MKEPENKGPRFGVRLDKRVRPPLLDQHSANRRGPPDCRVQTCRSVQA